MIDIQLLEYLETFISENRKTRFDQVLKERTTHFTVATEDVFQLHNTSAVLRTCDVFGIQEAHIIEEKNSKSIDKEIAMGAQKWVDLHRYDSIKDCISHLRENNYQIVATTPHKNDCSLQEFDVSKKSCFFFGKETEGLSKEVLEEADVFLNIPMVGFTESLNISVSAAIILQHVTHRLKQTDVDWSLSREHQLKKRMEWSKKTIKSYDEIVKRFHNKL